MYRYSDQTRVLVAVDCIIFGFDGEEFKLLLIQRGFEPEQNKWSLMGGFIQPNENMQDGAKRVLKQLTGLDGVYLEQIPVFGEPNRDPVERTIVVPYFSLIDIQKYETQLSADYKAKWFNLDEMPELIFDHEEMVEIAKMRLRYKAALHPILLELLPEKFTLLKMLTLYERLYDTSFDKRNFTKKVLSSGLLVRQEEKDKMNSRRGAHYYKLNRMKYHENFGSFIKFIPNPEKFQGEKWSLTEQPLGLN